MKSIALVLGFLAAVNCAHVTTVQDVNGLIDKTIVEIRKEKEIKLPELPGVVITGLENLKRHGNCAKTTKAGVFECRAISEEAKVTAEGEYEDVIIHMKFEVTVDSEGHLIKYEIVETDIELKEQDGSTPTFYKGWLKKAWDKIKKIAKEALHEVISKKIHDIVITIANIIIG